MSLLVWPDDLPQRFQRDGFSQGFGDGRLRTSMETGPQKTRRRFSSVTRPLQVTMDERADAFARLHRFYDDDTKGGSLPFLIRDQMQDGLPLGTEDGAILQDETGADLLFESWLLVMFGDAPPTPQDRGGGWYRSTFPLVIMP